MYINCGITLVVMNNVMCPTRLSLVPKATCLIMHTIPYVLILEVIEMVSCLTFTSHLPNETLSN